MLQVYVTIYVASICYKYMLHYIIYLVSICWLIYVDFCVTYVEHICCFINIYFIYLDNIYVECEFIYVDKYVNNRRYMLQVYVTSICYDICYKYMLQVYVTLYYIFRQYMLVNICCFGVTYMIQNKNIYVTFERNMLWSVYVVFLPW